MAEDIYQKADDAAEFPPTVAKDDLLGQVFTIVRATQKETEYGPNWIATILCPPDSEEELEFWGGVVVNRQLLAILEDLPATFTLTRDSKKNSPFILRAPDGAPAPGAEAEPPVTQAEPPKDSKLTAAAKSAGAKEVGRNKDALKNFRNEDQSIKWHYFLERWQGEGLGMDQLGSVIGAISAQALDHWFKGDKTRTITTLKEAALAGRTPAEEELPFE